MATAAGQRRWGRPITYSERVIVKALAMMIIRRLYTAYSLLAFLEQETELTCHLRALLTQDGRFPSRRTWERRLATLPDGLRCLIGCLGRHLVTLLQPWAREGRAVAVYSTALHAKGGVWHQKLPLVCTVSALWIPLAAELTPAHVPDPDKAPALLPQLPAEVRFLLGDTIYNDPVLHSECEQHVRFLVATQPGKYPHADPGVDVRKIFHRCCLQMP